MDTPINQIVCGDCLEVMKEWPDNCVDLVLTDPPYGLNYDKHAHKASGTQYGRAAAPKGKYINTDWDVNIPKQIVFDQIVRISSSQIVFGAEHISRCLPKSRGWIVWDKQTGSNNFSDCELLWTSFDRPIKKYRYMWNGMLQENMAAKEQRVHPTQKPVGLVMRILKDCPTQSTVILDPFCGSGTTCVAAKMLGRNYIGIDISEEYCEIARARLKAVDTGVPAKEAKAGQLALFGKGE